MKKEEERDEGGRRFMKLKEAEDNEVIAHLFL
jgi:hypothetical protein